MMGRLIQTAGKNPFAAVAVGLAGIWVLLALMVPVLPLPDPAQTTLSMRLLPPGTSGHILGTDLLGRDVLARLLGGTRLSLMVAITATLVAGAIGSLLGLLAGTARGWLDGVIMRLTDVVMAFPYLLLALAIVAVLGPGPGNALVAMAIVNIPFFARSVRGAVLPVAGSDFVTAARMAGRSPAGVVFREVLPNVLPVIVVTATTTLGWMLLETAGLSFLGLGVQPPAADLGSMLAESRKLMLVQPWQAVLPGIVVFVLVLGTNLGGDLLRDILDPRAGADASAPGRATAVEAPSEGSAPVDDPLMIENLHVLLRTRDGGAAEIVAGVSLQIASGQSLGLVGESGSGKSATALAAMRLLPSPPLTIARGTAVLFISHDMDVVARTCGRIAVMYAGEIVEEAPSGDLLRNPLHPYTRALLACRPGRGSMEPIDGRPPQPGDFPRGCRFAPRCSLADDACRAGPVALTRSRERSVRCLHTRNKLPTP